MIWCLLVISSAVHEIDLDICVIDAGKRDSSRTAKRSAPQVRGQVTAVITCQSGVCFAAILNLRMYPNAITQLCSAHYCLLSSATPHKPPSGSYRLCPALAAAPTIFCICIVLQHSLTIMFGLLLPTVNVLMWLRTHGCAAACSHARDPARCTPHTPLHHILAPPCAVT